VAVPIGAVGGAGVVGAAGRRIDTEIVLANESVRQTPFMPSRMRGINGASRRRLAAVASTVLARAAALRGVLGGRAAATSDAAGAIETLASTRGAAGGAITVGVGGAGGEVVWVDALVVGVALPIGRALLIEIAGGGRCTAGATLLIADFARRAVAGIAGRVAIQVGVTTTAHAGLADDAARGVVGAGAAAATFGVGNPGVRSRGEMAVLAGVAIRVLLAHGGLGAETTFTDA